jgi:hypothetical protein
MTQVSKYETHVIAFNNFCIMNNIYSTLLISLGLLCLLFLTTSCSKKGFVSVNTNEIVLTINSPEAELIVTASGKMSGIVEGNLGYYMPGILTEWFSMWNRDGTPDGRPPEKPLPNPAVYIIRLREDIDITSARSSTITFTSESNTETVTVRFMPD